MGFNIVEDWKGAENTVSVKKKTILATCEAVITAMEKGLPSEAHTIEIFDYVLQESKEMLRRNKIKLE